MTGTKGIDKREVAGKGESRDIGFTKRIYSDAAPLVFIGAAEARGIEKGIAPSIQVRYEDIRPGSTRAGLEGLLAGEIARRSSSDDVSIAKGIYRDAVAKVVVAPAEIGGINRVAACRVKLSDKGIVVAAKGTLEGPVGGGKVG